MKTKYIFISIVLILVITACQEKDAPILEGDIHGTVLLNDGYGFPVSDKSGVQVQLTGEDTELETTTDNEGRYIFKGIPFGNYHIKLIRENYIEKNWNYSFGHVGGDVPTSISQVMNEVPLYYYGIDSLMYYPSHYNFSIYTHVIGATKEFAFLTFCVQFFFSRSPDVSCENYEYSFIEIRWTYGDAYISRWYHGNFLNGYTGTIYCRVYPQTTFDKVWGYFDQLSPQVFPETLGPPSEVFSFTNEGVTRTDPD